jgi:myotubularin-related protein 6/7/8
VIVVPKKISDNVLFHAAKFRSKGRLPVLSYLHENGVKIISTSLFMTVDEWFIQFSITRSSQPLVGIQRKRSIQDEKLIEAIFSSHMCDSHYGGGFQNGKKADEMSAYGGTRPSHRLGEGSGCGVDMNKKKHLILDARPTANAMANWATGAGSENMEHYKGSKRHFLGIDNIHVMRESHSKFIESILYTREWSHLFYFL